MVVGFTLKGLLTIILIVLIIVNILTYEERYTSQGSFPKPRFWLLLFISIGIFIYNLYLNTQPEIILF